MQKCGMNKTPKSKVETKQYIFTNHGKDGSIGSFYHIFAASPTLAIRKLINEHGKAPYKILAVV